MQEQNLEEWKEKIDRSAEQITVPDTLTPGAVQQMLEERKNRTSAGRKEHRHYRRFAGIAAAVIAVLLPGTLMKMCMMDTMRCYAVMRPFAWIMGALIALLSLLDLTGRIRQKTK